MTSILFVCTGNICRSPTADAVFKMLVEKREANYEADSAGTHGYHVGEQPDRRTMQVAKEKGVDMSDLCARKLTRDDFDTFDYLIALDNGHLESMKRIATPAQQKKIYLFLDFLPGHEGENVPDPYYGGADGFHHVYDLVHKGCEALLDSLENRAV